MGRPTDEGGHIFYRFNLVLAGFNGVRLGLCCDLGNHSFVDFHGGQNLLELVEHVIVS